MVKEKAKTPEVSKDMLAVPQRDGSTIHVQLPPQVDYSRPHADDDGVTPEFVNISAKVQGVRIIGVELMHQVPPLGILRGAQWRNLSKPDRKTWGNHPKFLERVKTKQKAGKDEVLHDPSNQRDVWSPQKGSEYDRKYLLTEEQITNEIKGDGTKAKPGIGNVKLIKLLTRNAVMQDTEDVTMLGYRKVHQGPITYENNENVCARPRLREDRMKVEGIAGQRMDWLEDQAREAREATGIYEEDV